MTPRPIDLSADAHAFGLTDERDQPGDGDGDGDGSGGHGVLALAFDPSGTRLAVGGSDTIRVYDLRDGTAVESYWFVFVDGFEDDQRERGAEGLEGSSVVDLRFTADGRALVAEAVYPFVFPQGDARAVLRAFDRSTGAPILGVCATPPDDDGDNGCRAWALSPDGSRLVAVTSRESTVFDLQHARAVAALPAFAADPVSDHLVEPGALAVDPSGVSVAGWVPWGRAGELLYVPGALVATPRAPVARVEIPTGFVVEYDTPRRDRARLAFCDAGNALIAAEPGTRRRRARPPGALHWVLAEPAPRMVPLAHDRALDFRPYQLDPAAPAVWWCDAATGSPRITVLRQSLVDGTLTSTTLDSPGGRFRGAAISPGGTHLARTVEHRVYVHDLRALA